MADTVDFTSSRTRTSSSVDDLYSQAAEMTFNMGAESDGTAPQQTEPVVEAPATAAEGAQAEADSTHGVIRRATAGQKAEITQMGELSILRIEQLRSDNVELRSEVERLRQEIARLRERNAALEATNFELDERASELHAAEKKIAELQRGVEYARSARRHMIQELKTAQQNLVETEKRFAHTDAQLRAICQERADRITVLTEELKVVARSKAELEREVETLLGYRRRAMACLHQLTEELKRVRKENREKSRRLSEARAVLQSIDARLAESITEPEGCVTRS